MSDTPIAFRTHERGQGNPALTMVPSTQCNTTPTGYPQTHQSTLTQESSISGLNEELPPISALGTGPTTPTLVSQMGIHIPQSQQSPAAFQNTLEYRNSYENIFGEGPDGNISEIFERVRGNRNMSVHEHPFISQVPQTLLTQLGPQNPTPGPSGVPHSSIQPSPIMFAPRPSPLRPYMQGLPHALSPHPYTPPLGTIGTSTNGSQPHWSISVKRH